MGYINKIDFARQVKSYSGDTAILSGNTYNIGGFTGGTHAQFLGTVQGFDAVNNNEFITKSQLSNFNPFGQKNQILYASKDNSNEYVVGDEVAIGKFIINDVELAQAKTDITTQLDIFNTWKRFAFGTIISGSPSSLIITNNIPGYPLGTNSWLYNSGTTTISSQFNTGPYLGFISKIKTDNYTNNATFFTSAISGDNDKIGLVIAFVEDANDLVTNQAYGTPSSAYTWNIDITSPTIPNQHALVMYRNRNGNTQVSYGIVYNPGKFTEKIIYDGTNTGVYNTTAPWDGVEVDVQVIRSGDTITIKTTDYSDAPGGKGVLGFSHTITLLDDPVLEKFRGASHYGYMAQSQAFSSFKNISVNIDENTIYDLRQGNVWVIDSGDTYVISPTRTFYNEIGVRRILFNPTTEGLYYVKDDEEYEILTKSQDAILNQYSTIQPADFIISGNGRMGNCFVTNYSSASLFGTPIFSTDATGIDPYLRFYSTPQFGHGLRIKNSSASSGFTANQTSDLMFPNSTGRTYYFQDGNGTLAFLSDLASLDNVVHLTGHSSETKLGDLVFSGSSTHIMINGNGINTDYTNGGSGDTYSLLFSPTGINISATDVVFTNTGDGGGIYGRFGNGSNGPLTEFTHMMITNAPTNSKDVVRLQDLNTFNNIVHLTGFTNQKIDNGIQVYDESTSGRTLQIFGTGIRNGDYEITTNGANSFFNTNIRNGFGIVGITGNIIASFNDLNGAADNPNINFFFQLNGTQASFTSHATDPDNVVTLKDLPSYLTNPMTTVGDIIVGGTSGVTTRMADVDTGNVLLSGGIATAPSYGKVTKDHVDNTIVTINAIKENLSDTSPSDLTIFTSRTGVFELNVLLGVSVASTGGTGMTFTIQYTDVNNTTVTLLMSCISTGSIIQNFTSVGSYSLVPVIVRIKDVSDILVNFTGNTGTVDRLLVLKQLR